MASQLPPGRTGASHSSHAKPSTIRPSRLPTAATRVQPTEGGGAWRGAGWGAEEGWGEAPGGVDGAGGNMGQSGPQRRQSTTVLGKGRGGRALA
ncbi:hypothetical protein GCM10028785_04690 [Hydrogenophaga soli]